MISVNTNMGAMIALQNLNATNMQLQQTENRISTGLKVSSAKDDGSTWAIAQSQRATISSLDTVKSSLARASSTVDVALSAGQTVSDLLTQMKQKALAASDSSLDATSMAALNNDFQSLRDQISKVVSNAAFNGTNLLDGSVASIAPLANASGSSVITVNAQNLSLGGSIVTIAATDTIGTTALAQTMVGTCDTCINNVNAALARLGTSSSQLTEHSNFVSKLQDTMQTGVGNLVDANMAQESARLQALQTKQQLGVQALSIANQAPAMITTLFR